MNFFARQEDARKRTARLVFLFVAAVAGVIVAADVVIGVGAAVLLHERTLPLVVHEALALTIIAAVALFAARRLYQLRGGGEAVARMVSARQVLRNTGKLEEQRLLNIVDEMAIASGVNVPSVWIMDKEEGINAFAAGYSPNQAVIVVTRGALATLNREELQGVVGHEFGHILNGDMRLNVRLIGILAGIVVVGEAGLLVIRLGAEANDSGALPFILFGALIAGIGYFGLFCGRVIKAAVSRQREFLADASSVQFTRNPDGLAGALEKIRRSTDATTVRNAYAGELSHMFFGQAFRARFFANLFATHPPIEERLASITGRRPEDLAKPPGDSAPAAPQQQDDAAETLAAATSAFGGEPVTLKNRGDLSRNIVERVGSASPKHMDYAARCLAALPEALRQSLNTPAGARSAVYAYLAADDAAVRGIQDQALDEGGDGALAGDIDALAATLRQLGSVMRLPILTLALSALRQMDQPARDGFLSVVDQLVEADHEVTIDEFVLRTILRRQLHARSSHAEPVRFRSIAAVKADALVLLAALARAGSEDAEARTLAFARGADRLHLTADWPADSSATPLGNALDRLRGLTPLQKPGLILACVDTALADDKLRVPEMELLRAIGMAIDCPLPPLIDDYAVET